MKTFLGRSTHTLDEKARLILPKRLLDRVAELDRDFVLTAGPEGCLLLIDAATWEEMAKRIDGSVLGTKQQRLMRRIFLGHAEQVKPDKANRITIADGLRAFAGIGEKSEVILLGTGKSFEIWAKERWESQMADSLASYEFSENDLVGSTAASQP
ncbi:MAG: division/cell wall cluster transcriptional repressor MraZ [Planctomycetes bacterium]|nr:division/cell wall cluster transcriptional repressor MraZ [Planctomycetota bacterium]